MPVSVTTTQRRAVYNPHPYTLSAGRPVPHLNTSSSNYLRKRIVNDDFQQDLCLRNFPFSDIYHKTAWMNLSSPHNYGICNLAFPCELDSSLYPLNTREVCPSVLLKSASLVFLLLRTLVRLWPVPVKTRRVGERCTLTLSIVQTYNRRCGGVVRREEGVLRCHPRHLTMVQNYEVRHQKQSYR
ncbi:hypothetical protein TNCV_4487151 [Trichonephila clavipes]|nr:hypothetical protein TNCV_4487151 [Trichonephila clavipes]